MSFDIMVDLMPRKKYTSEEIVAKLRQVDVLVSQARTSVTPSRSA